MRKIFLLIAFCFIGFFSFAQNFNLDSSLRVINAQKDSVLRASKFKRDSIYQSDSHKDSVKTNKEYAEIIKWEKIKAIEIFPQLNAGENSGVAPVVNPDEVPDQKMQYKLLFELTANNPDSSIKEINYGLVEVARILNLHVASGIPIKNIIPVVVVHAGALHALKNNEYFNKKYKSDNPNIKLIGELEKLGTKFIACGQAMTFLEIQKEAFLPVVKVSLTAKTVLTNYQLKGFVLMAVDK
jgi:intracellular sulfur oxidation DsrE/DsrF family protein